MAVGQSPTRATTGPVPSPAPTVLRRSTRRAAPSTNAPPRTWTGANDSPSNRYARSAATTGSRSIRIDVRTPPMMRSPAVKSTTGMAAPSVPARTSGAHIPPYLPASNENHEPDRARKLLLHRREIERLIGKTAERGLTLVPTRIYFKGPRAKVELALAKGKEGRDRRRDIQERDQRREIERDYKQRMR